MRELDTIERALALEPDDRELRLVFADALSERGDPRGELIVVSDHIATKTATDAQHRRARELRIAAERELAHLTREPFARFTWRHGLIERVDFVGNPKLEDIAQLLQHAALRFVRELDLRTFASGTAPSRRAVIDLILELGPPLPLRWLGLGSLRATPDSDQVAALRRTLPGLRGLAVFTERTADALAMVAGLRDLEINALDLDGLTLYELLGELPGDIERLVVHANPITLDQLAPLFVPNRFPALRSLGVMAQQNLLNAEIFRRLETTGLLAQLESFGFTNNGYSGWLVEVRALLAPLRLFTAPNIPQRLVESWQELGQLYETLERRDEALAMFDSLVTIRPGSWEFHAGAGRQLASFGRHADAFAMFDAAVVCDPRAEAALVGRATNLQSLQRWEEALATWNRLGASGIDPAYLANSRAFTLIELARYDEALVALDTALAVAPNDLWTLSSRATALGHLRRTEEALVAHRRVLARANLDDDVAATTWASMAILCHSRKRTAIARRHFERAAKLVTKPDHAKWILALLGDLLLDEGEHAEASKIWKRLVRLGTITENRGHIGEGWTQLDLGRAHRAVVAFERATAFNAQGRALALHAAGRSDEALVVLVDAGEDASCPYAVAVSALIAYAIEHARSREDDAQTWLATIGDTELGDIALHDCPANGVVACGARVAMVAVAAAHLAGDPDVHDRSHALLDALEAGDGTSECLWELRFALRLVESKPSTLIERAIRAVEGTVPISELAALVRPKRP